MIDELNNKIEVQLAEIEQTRKNESVEEETEKNPNANSENQDDINGAEKVGDKRSKGEGIHIRFGKWLIKHKNEIESFTAGCNMISDCINSTMDSLSSIESYRDYLNYNTIEHNEPSLEIDIPDNELILDSDLPGKRSSPCEHEVTGYSRKRYGKIENVRSYNRGGKAEDR